MPFLAQAVFSLTDPAKPDEFEYSIVMGTDIDDGFGGRTIAYKAFKMKEAIGAGFDLKFIAKEINETLSAGLQDVTEDRDRLKQELDLLKGQVADFKSQFEEAKASASLLTDQMTAAVEQRDQKIAELTAIINKE